MSYPYFEFIVYSFKIFATHIFCGQIWFQNLKLFELTEIRYRGTLLYAYYHFNVYFFSKFI